MKFINKITTYDSRYNIELNDANSAISTGLYCTEENITINIKYHGFLLVFSISDVVVLQFNIYWTGEYIAVRTCWWQDRGWSNWTDII